MNKEDIKKHGIGGLKVELTYFTASDTSAEELEPHTFVQRIVTFNDEGEVTEEKQFTPESEESLRIRQVHASGRLVEKEIFDHGEQTEKWSYEYNGDGQLIAEKLHYLDGSFDITEISYDGKALVRKVMKDDEGKVEGKVEYTNDGDLPIEIKTYGEDDELLERITITYEGREVKERSKYDEFGELESKVTNTYEEGRLVAQEHFSDHRADQVVDKDLQYDDQGRHYKTIALNDDGEPEMQLEMFFDERGLVIREEESVRGDAGMVVNLIREYKYS